MRLRQRKLQKRRSYANAFQWIWAWDQPDANCLKHWGRPSLYSTLAVQLSLIGELIRRMNSQEYCQFQWPQLHIRFAHSGSKAVTWLPLRIRDMASLVVKSSFLLISKSISVILQHCRNGALSHWRNVQSSYLKSSKTSRSHLIAYAASIRRMASDSAILRWSIAVISSISQCLMFVVNRWQLTWQWSSITTGLSVSLIRLQSMGAAVYTNVSLICRKNSHRAMVYSELRMLKVYLRLLPSSRIRWYHSPLIERNAPIAPIKS